MIKSKLDLKYYLEADRIALARTMSPFFSIPYFKSIFIPDYIWRFQKIMRRLEYYKNCNTNIIGNIKYAFLVVKFHRLSYRLGFSISINSFGPGLSIAHHGTIIINKGSIIGANCRLHAGVNIGTEAGFATKAPEIGNNVYIGPGAKIFGHIRIADNIAIGANAVVNKSFNEEYIAIAGVPAKKISTIKENNFLIKATEILNEKST